MKKIWIHILIGALIGSVFSALPAQAATEVPAEVNIEDLAQDSNGVNDQGSGLGFGDTPGGVYFGGADILKVWFSNTATDLNVHFLTSGPGNAGDHSYAYRVHTNDDCIWFQGMIYGAAIGGDPTALLRDECGEAEDVEGTATVETLEDETAITTLTFPQGALPGLEEGATITTPYATSRMIVPETFNTVPQLDSTVVGTDYVITAGEGVAPPPKVDPPVKKGKGKKKKAKKGCAAYQPGEMGAEAESIKLTDSATEEAPLEVTVTQAEGMGNDLGLGEYDGTAHQYLNVQVDPKKAKEVGLYARYEFPEFEDHDLYVHYADGAEAAHVGGFNPFPFIPANPVFATDGTGAGGHSEQGAEQLDGLRTADCAGYTLDLVNFLGAGGDYTVKLWFGEIQNDPAAPAGPEV